MTTPPPYGSAPGQPSGYSGQPGQPGQPYPQSYPGPASAPQPAYGQQPGYPPAGYPAAGGAYPGFGGPAPLARPGMVTAAAILAFVWGGFAVILSIISLFVSGLTSVVSDACTTAQTTDPTYYDAYCRSVGGYSSFFKIISVGLIILAVLLIWGGVTTLSGKNSQILVIACGLYVVLAIVGLIAGGGAFSGIVGIVAPILILVFLFNPASRAWFRAKGGKTF